MQIIAVIFFNFFQKTTVSLSIWFSRVGIRLYSTFLTIFDRVIIEVISRFYVVFIGFSKVLTALITKYEGSINA